MLPPGASANHATFDAARGQARFWPFADHARRRHRALHGMLAAENAADKHILYSQRGNLHRPVFVCNPSWNVHARGVFQMNSIIYLVGLVVVVLFVLSLLGLR